MDWTEILITVKTEAVEAVANLIHESGAGGVVLEHVDNQRSTVTAYFPQGEETKNILAGLQDFWSRLDELGITADAQVTTSSVAEQDWAEEWKKHYQPVQVGRVTISPSWIDTTPAAGQILIELDPGMAFGTGTHPTTQMCISALTTAVSSGKTVLDLGSGSGILSIVSAKLGADTVDAVDNDRVAVEVAAENARRNQCTININKDDAFARFSQSNHDVVVANIGFSVCAKLADIFVDEGKECTLILSGFPEERMDELRIHAGGKFISADTKEGWGCMVLGSL